MKRRRWLLLSGVLLFAVATSLHVDAAAQDVPANSNESKQGTESGTSSGDEAFDQKLYIEAFDIVWNTIKTTHWDPQVAGEKWDAARDRFRPRMDECKSAGQAHEVMEEMLGELGQSHFGIIPRAAYAAIERQASRGGPGWSGITLRWLGEQFVVTHVHPKSPGENAGVKVGWVVRKSLRLANDQTILADDLSRDAQETAKHLVMRLETELGLRSAALVSGAVGEKLRIEFLDHDDQPIEKELELVKGPGDATKLGNLPTVYVDFEERSLDGGIGYVRFNAFLDGPRLINAFQQAVNREQNQKGFIIDLRGNLGGLVILAMGMSGWFVDEPLSLGKMLMKNTPLKIAINPRQPKYQGPIAVLVDECSISCAELLSGGLQGIGAARVFGTRTAGLVLPSTVVKLPTGDGFQYAMAGFESSSGRELEKNGVEPDEMIPLTRENLKADSDPVLSAAVDWINRQNVAAAKDK